MTDIRGNGSVRFRFFRPDAKSVAISGDFNGWEREQGALAMRPDVDEGWWVAEAQFQPGEYRFRYCADGTWFADFASHGVEWNKQGWDSVLVVKDVGMAAARATALAA